MSAGVATAVAFLVLALSVASRAAPEANAQNIRINSPRQDESQPPQQQQGGRGSGSGRASSGRDADPPAPKEADGRQVLVRLPDDLEAVLNLQKSDRSRIHASILGLADGQHGDAIKDILEGNRKVTSTLTTSGVAYTTASPNPSHATTTATPLTMLPTQSTTRKKNVNHVTESVSTEAPPDVVVDAPTRSFWTIAWEAHIYFSGTLFVLLAMYCTVNVIRLHTFSRLFSRGYFVALNLCIIILGVLRPVYLFHDPYNADGSLPRVAAYLLLDTGFPCMTTAFAILFLALLRATQIELVSSAFQTPKALGIFCGVHFALSMSIDIAIGVMVEIRYCILICQGFFIVWSLLLSAGYFYIFSAMKKVAIRTNSDMMRAVYPKLVIDGSYADTHRSALPSSQPPLARAVHLMLGVAVLGSLMGGVQLFGMIKMLGLQKSDMSNNHNELAWFGYQVSMRVLEVLMCTLLAVIATTPLRSDPDSTRSSRSSSSNWCCFRARSMPRIFEEDIYSEICSNNQSVRHVLSGDRPAEYPYGTLARCTPAMPMGTLTSSSLALGGGNFPMNQKRSATGSMSSNANSTLIRGASTAYGQQQQQQQQAQMLTSGTSSRATLDTQLYSNVRSRPSSMLFNDSGFVRFRAEEDPKASFDMKDMHFQQQALLDLERERVRSSQSFDDSILLIDQQIQLQQQELISPGSQPGSHLHGMDAAQSGAVRRSNRGLSRQSPIYKSIDSLHSDGQDAAYEAPAGMRLPHPAAAAAAAAQVGYSESDLSSVDPTYAARSQIYSSRAPSRCSSISATQSFDMRMYGKVAMAQKQQPPTSQTYAVTTLRRNEEAKEKLENPYYYYGSTRNQKKAQPQKPRPLLPSQRQQLITSASGPGLGRHQQQPDGRPPSRSAAANRQTAAKHETEALLAGEASASANPFQRSRSLGGHYRSDDGNGGPMLPPQRNQQEQQHRLFLPPRAGALQSQPAGSLTPLSYSRWQHVQQQQQQRGGRNPALFDAPPAARHNAARQQQQQQLQDRQLSVQAGFLPLHRGGGGDGGGRLGQQRRPTHEQLLSPILTEQEVSPLHQRIRQTAEADESTDDFPSEGESDDAVDQFTSQATQGYSEGLADNELESEVSSIFGYNGANDLDQQKNLHLMSPLEYSAMLKLYSAEDRFLAKDVTPDSGVLVDGSSDSNKSRQLAAAAKEARAREAASSKNLASSESKSKSKAGKQYSQVSTNEAGQGDSTCVFSSSSEDEDDTMDAAEPATEPPFSETGSSPAFRWDGSEVASRQQPPRQDSSSSSGGARAPVPPQRIESKLPRADDAIKLKQDIATDHNAQKTTKT